MVCTPAVSADVDRVACAPPPIDADPKLVTPSLNVTVPVGRPPTVDVIVAVSVIDWPRVDGLTDEERRVVAAALPTTVTDVDAVLFGVDGSDCTPVTCVLAAKVPAAAAVTEIV